MTYKILARLCGVVLGLSLFIPAALAQSAKEHLQLGQDALDRQDYRVASQSFADAFKGGEPDGAFLLGRMLELGLGGAADIPAAIALYIAGDAKGSAPAKNRLGVLHIEGRGVLQDYERGAALVCEAAELGDLNGAFNCANLLLEGRGLEKNDEKAYEWFRVASERGHIGAKNLYASALFAGTSLEQDHAGAIELFQQTAAEGNPFGLYSLGQAFAYGLGTEKDLIKSHAFLNLAAALNYPLAADARAQVEKNMTDDEIRSAQQFAKSWKPKPQSN